MSWAGMNAASGRRVDELDHVRQSVRDILLTPIGSRVMRRDYGSLIPSLIDQPINEGTRLRLAAACVMALLRWEPRLRPTRVQIHIDASGRVELELAATVDRTAVSFSTPLSGASA